MEEAYWRIYDIQLTIEEVFGKERISTECGDDSARRKNLRTRDRLGGLVDLETEEQFYTELEVYSYCT